MSVCKLWNSASSLTVLMDQPLRYTLCLRLPDIILMKSVWRVSACILVLRLTTLSFLPSIYWIQIQLCYEMNPVIPIFWLFWVPYSLISLKSFSDFSLHKYSYPMIGELMGMQICFTSLPQAGHRNFEMNISAVISFIILFRPLTITKSSVPSSWNNNNSLSL